MQTTRFVLFMLIINKHKFKELRRTLLSRYLFLYKVKVVEQKYCAFRLVMEYITGCTYISYFCLTY